MCIYTLYIIENQDLNLGGGEDTEGTIEEYLKL